MRPFLSDFFIILKGNDLKNISLHEIWNLRGVCSHIDCRWTAILFRILRVCGSLFKCNYVKNEKLSQNFFFHWWNLNQILNSLKKKKIVIAYVFPKLQNVKDLVRPLSKKQCLRTSLESQHVKASETIVKSAWEHFYQTFSSLPGEMILKMFRWAKFEILGLFLNTLTADDKYLVWHYERLQFPIQMQVC